MRRVYGFPGQGSQFRGMGADLFDAFPDLVAQADEILGYSIREQCLDDPGNQLRQTHVTQPALYVVETLAYLNQQKLDDSPPDILVGHSIGEYAALFAAQVFSFDTGLRLVLQRGRLMTGVGGGGMAAIIGPDLAAIERLLVEYELRGLDIAAHNAPGQIVLAGPVEELERARAPFEAAGAEVMPLEVSAPFHSRYMRPAAEAFSRELDRYQFRPPAITVIANVDGLPHKPERLKESLTQQIASTVRWVESIRHIMSMGDFSFQELGPGRVLTGLIKQIRRAPLSS